MEDMARAEYPAMLANLQPGQAVQVFNDRVKRINRVNLEIADWLQERRRVEEQYIQGLRRLATFKVPNSQSELGVFQAPWNKIIDSVETVAHSHALLAERIEKDVEHPLRNFQNRKDVHNMNVISANLASISRDLEEAQNESDKLNKKGGKASARKVDTVTSKLESASQQWESQAPFIFENLQALDESRVNNLRDLLTQYQTHESDQARRTEENATETLALMLEIDTDREIQNFVQRTTNGRTKLPPRTATRQSSIAGTTGSAAQIPPSTADTTRSGTMGSNSLEAPPTPRTPHEGDNSEQGSFHAPEPEPKSKLRRLGTMFGGRRRQSVHAGFGGFGQLSPQKGTPSFGRLGSSHGHHRGVSPRASATNLHGSTGLSSLPETPSTSQQERELAVPKTESHDNTNGVKPNQDLLDTPVPPVQSSTVNGTHEVDVSDVPPPPGPPPSHTQDQEARPPTTPGGKDSEGFNVPPPMNDPISEAQREAAGEEADQFFKLNIQNTPVEEEDPQAKQAALSSVVNTLKMGPATRRSGTVRGRRDVRNTVYMGPQPQIPESQTESTFSSIPGSPSLPTSHSKGSAVAALASEHSVAATSDTQSVRSGNSLGSLAHFQHPDLHGPGLNSSIIETVSAVFDEGELKSASIAGEVAFVNNPSESGEVKSHETIKINNFPKLEKIGPNRIFVHNTSPEHPDQFTLDVAHLTRTSTAFSYRVYADESETPSLGEHAPMALKLAWKPQGDKLGLLVMYNLNPASNLTTPVTLHNVVFVATYEGRASGAQTKPSGTHLKDKHLVYWRLGDVTLTNEQQKLVCRIVGAEGAEPKPGHVEVRWEYNATGDEVVGSGISISKLEEGKGKAMELSDDDPFADASLASSTDQKWVDVPVARKLISGKYEGR